MGTPGSKKHHFFMKNGKTDTFLHIERTDVSKRQILCEPRPETEMFDQKVSILTEVQQVVDRGSLIEQ